MQRLTLRDSITQARVAERRLAVHDSSPAWLGSRVWEWRTELRLTVTSESSRASSAVGSAAFGSQTADLAHTGPRHEGTLTWLASQQLFGAAKLLASRPIGSNQAVGNCFLSISQCTHVGSVQAAGTSRQNVGRWTFGQRLVALPARDAVVPARLHARMIHALAAQTAPRHGSRTSLHGNDVC